MTEHKIWCGVCEATCGLVATVEQERITKIRPDDTHPNSQGFACPKGILYPQVLEDPDRVREPLQRQADGSFVPVSWDVALDDIGRRLRASIAAHGRESIGCALGNPTGWNYGAFFGMFGMAAALKTKHFFTAGSVDINNYWVVGELLYGHNLVNPMPDFDRATFALIVGANPVVSHGSMATIGNIRRRMTSIVERGGRIVVVDPRRSETAALFEHVPVRPDSDAFLLVGMLKVILDEGLQDDAALARQTTGADALAHLVADVDLDVVAAETGIARATVEQLARDLAAADAAVVYGRCGASLSRFSTLTKYLLDVLGIVTGNLDRPGGMVFADPFLDAEAFTKLFRVNGYDRWRTRVDGIPEVLGTSPLATLPREVLTPGRGQLRALVAVSTNMATTSPASGEMEKALGALDLFVSLDPYITETSRLADYILPPKMLLEREGFPLFGQLHYGVPNASWTDAIVPAPEGVRDDWWVIDQICKRMKLVPSPAPGAQLLGRLGVRIPPHVAVDMFMRIGRHGDWFGLRRGGLSRKKLLAHDGAIKLADGNATGVLRKKIHTKDRRVHLEHDVFARELRRLLATPSADAEHPLRLFTVRELRSQNSWLHNVPKLMSGGRGCRLRIHPDDAAARGIEDGATIALASRWGRIEVEAKLTDEVMPGSVGLNQHWGHKGGWKTAVAAGGGRYNDLVPNDAAMLDAASGNAWLNGIGVEAVPLAVPAPAPAVAATA
ncbi:MAG: molybdopterin oxidoreductase [Solirubrobacterales bacterium]|nr:molybdopterin oxidoreductase [Solirubrobacterales bacterium]